MRSEGLERVTMRRLAGELDTGAAAPYVYFHNAAELGAAVLAELLAEVDLSPVTADGDWRGRLLTVLGVEDQRAAWAVDLLLQVTTAT